MKQKLITIDMDLIKSLRRSYRWQEADKLLEAYHNDVRKAGRQAVNERKRHDRMIKKSKGICISDECFEKVTKGCVSCEKHLIRNRDYQRERKGIKR